jgi:DNA-binding response OmpR family regulator
MRIALLEADAQAASSLVTWLTIQHDVRVFDKSTEFTRELECDAFDVAIVGGSEPGVNGTELVMRLRRRTAIIMPIMRMIPQAAEADIVNALNAGADDCVTQPPSRQEFIARVGALARRARCASDTRAVAVKIGELSVDRQNRVIVRDGKVVPMTPKAYDLAVMMLLNVGKLLTREQLIDQVWGGIRMESTRTLDTHMSRLRLTLGLTPAHGWVLQSVYQHGYRLERVTEDAAGVLALRMDGRAAEAGHA